MDLATALIGSILLILSFSPFIFYYFYNKSRENKLYNLLTSLAQSQSSVITKYEVCNDFIIGLDESSRTLFFCKESKEKKIQKHISLKDVIGCKIVKTSNHVDSKSNGFIAIDFLGLSIEYVDERKPVDVLEFYDSSVNHQLSGELQMIEKWKTIISSKLKSLVLS